MPEEERTKADLETTLRFGNADSSYRAAIARLDRALQGSNFNNVMANLGLSDEVARLGAPANDAANRGETIRAMLEALIAKYDDDKKDAGNEAK